MANQSSWEVLNEAISSCSRCQRLREYCARVAREKRRAYLEWDYWGRPVPNFGDPAAKLLIVGLAPAAHGANRTGRMFTGDRSGEWLYRALHRAGLANQATSQSRDDGLALIGCAITAVAHCAPPDNKPTDEETDHCREWLVATLDLVPARVIIALGQIAWRGVVIELERRGWLSDQHFARPGSRRRARPKFSHGAEVPLAQEKWLLGSYHPSQQNTFTGRLTEPMLNRVFTRARQLCEGPES